MSALPFDVSAFRDDINGLESLSQKCNTFSLTHLSALKCVTLNSSLDVSASSDDIKRRTSLYLATLVRAIHNVFSRVKTQRLHRIFCGGPLIP